MQLLHGWRGLPAEGFTEDQILALRRLYALFWRPDDWTHGDAYGPTWRGLEKLQRVLDELSPAGPPALEPKRRGRTAGVNKIDMALTALDRRLKDGELVAIAAIAKEVRCDRKNLERSHRFMNAYNELVNGMTRAVRHRGRKQDGHMEAWIDPRGNRK
jgi:hypothetical protein